jgi:hypothetical protein
VSYSLKGGCMEYKDRLNQRKEEAEQFYKKYEIPFQHDTGIKDVLSGLSENSNGDGHNRRTVIHLVVKSSIGIEAEVRIGKLRRESGEFLCTRNVGKQWSGQKTERRLDANGEEYMPKVTCKECLRLMNKHLKKEDV